MLYSVEWLRRLCPADATDTALAETLTARGLTVDSVDTTPQGTVFDVDIPANRPDCLGHFGLARELSAALGIPLESRPEAPAAEEAADWVRVRIEAPDLCPRYTAALARGVEVRPSPGWVVRRLESCGLRSINNVVDASNLVLLETGQPIHFFDYALLRGADSGGPREIRVRRAGSGETLATLDGVERKLDPDMLVIADARRSVALAGVIGGGDTEIGVSTTDVLIEAACFHPQSIRATSRKLGVQTDASFRFERGVDAEAVPLAQALALRLLEELAGAETLPKIVDAFPAPPARRELELRFAQIERLLGYRPEPAAAVAALEALGLSPTAGEDRVRVVVPSWRPDLEREADLVEEVARSHGYDVIPTSAPATSVEATPDAPAELEERARDVLARQGFHEAIGYAMIGAGEDDRFVFPDAPPPLALTNPIAEPLSRLRRSILPGLLRAADLNHRRGSPDVRLFEVGRVFVAGEPGGLPLEPLRLGLIWSGVSRPRHWSAPAQPVDLFDLTGRVDQLLESLAPGIVAEREPGGPSGIHPRGGAVWRTGGQPVLAWGGALHPEIQAGHEHSVFLAEIELDALGALPRHPAQHGELPRFPAAARDLSLVMNRGLGFRRLLEVLGGVEPPAPVEFAAVDRYEGPPLGDDQIALTVRFTLQPADRTLTDAETEAYRGALLERLATEIEVKIRG